MSVVHQLDFHTTYGIHISYYSTCNQLIWPMYDMHIVRTTIIVDTIMQHRSLIIIHVHCLFIDYV